MLKFRILSSAINYTITYSQVENRVGKRRGTLLNFISPCITQSSITHSRSLLLSSITLDISSTDSSTQPAPKYSTERYRMRHKHQCGTYYGIDLLPKLIRHDTARAIIYDSMLRIASIKALPTGQSLIVCPSCLSVSELLCICITNFLSKGIMTLRRKRLIIHSKSRAHLSYIQ